MFYARLVFPKTSCFPLKGDIQETNDSKLPQMLKPCKQGQCPTVPPLLCQRLIPDNDGTAPDPTVTSEAPRDFAELLRTRVLFCLNNPHLKNEAVENSLQIPLHFLSAEEMSEINSKLATSSPCQKYLCLAQQSQPSQAGLGEQTLCFLAPRENAASCQHLNQQCCCCCC